MNRKKTNILPVLLCAVTVLVAAAPPAKTYRLMFTPIAPAAIGTVDVGNDRNGNTEVDLKVEHLAQPAALTPPATAYVVWFQEPGSEPRNVGQLKVDDDLEGQLKTVTPYRAFDALVTAEDDPAATKPSERIVLRGTLKD